MRQWKIGKIIHSKVQSDVLKELQLHMLPADAVDRCFFKLTEGFEYENLRQFVSFLKVLFGERVRFFLYKRSNDYREVVKENPSMKADIAMAVDLDPNFWGENYMEFCGLLDETLRIGGFGIIADDGLASAKLSEAFTRKNLGFMMSYPFKDTAIEVYKKTSDDEKALDKYPFFMESPFAVKKFTWGVPLFGVGSYFFYKKFLS